MRDNMIVGLLMTCIMGHCN